MGRSTLGITRLIDFPELRILRPENKKLFCNLRHLSWSLSSLAILAACSGGGGGGGGGGTAGVSQSSGGGAPANGGGALGGGGGVHIPDPTPSGQRSAATLEGLKAEVEKSPDDSGIIINLGDQQTWDGDGKFVLEGGKAYAYTDDGARLLNTEGQSDNARTPSNDKKASISGNNFDGTSGDDYFYGNNSGNEFDGGGGDDIVNGGTGGDTFNGGAGEDTLNGGGGEDALNGGDNNDMLNGDGNSDTLIGGSGDDNLNGGAGNDIIWGGSGEDAMTGGEGNDIFVIIGDNGEQFNYGAEKLTISIDEQGWHTTVDLKQELGLTRDDINSDPGVNEYVTGETVDGGGGVNVLIIFGEVDITAVPHDHFQNITQIRINSKLTLSAEQLNSLGDVEIVGEDANSELEIKYSNTGADSESDSDTEVDFSGSRDLDGQLKVSIDAGVTLKLKAEHLEDLKNDRGLKLDGDGEVDFDADIGAKELETVDEEKLGNRLTLKEKGRYSDGDERGGSVGKLAVDTSSGTKVGDIVSVGFDDPDVDILREIITYEWLRDGVIIEDAGTANYVLQAQDVGTELTVRVRYLDEFGRHAVTAQIGDVRGDTPGSVSFDTSEGTKVGAKVNAEVFDADGARDITYQWLRSGEEIDNSDGVSYILRNEDIGKEITVRATYTDDFGSDKVAESTATVGNVIVDKQGVVSVTSSTDTIVEGSVLTAKLTDDDDQFKPEEVEYTWFKEGDQIEGATGSAYEVQADDVGSEIHAKATYRENVREKAAFSTNIIPQALEGELIIVAPPRPKGGDDLFVTLTNPGAIDIGAGGFLVWLRDGVEISGSRQALPSDLSQISQLVYNLTSDDSGADVTAQIISGNAAADEAPLNSTNSIMPDTPGFITITASGGYIRTGTILTAHLHDPDDLMINEYVWLKDGEVISDAVGNTYILRAQDVGDEIAVRINYSESATGTTETFSAAVQSHAVISQDTPGIIEILATDGLGLYDTLTVNFDDADIPKDVSFQWFIGDAENQFTPITGATGIGYVLNENDLGKWISVAASYRDGDDNQTRDYKTIYASRRTDPVNDSGAEGVPDTASEDLKAFAELGDFTGDNPQEEVRLINLAAYERWGATHSRLLEGEVLDDSSFENVELGQIFRLRNANEVKSALDDLGISTTDAIIFTTGSLRANAEPLKDLLDTYTNAIYIDRGAEYKGKRIEASTRYREEYETYKQLAEEGRIYSAAYAEESRGSLDLEALHSPVLQNYFFTESQSKLKTSDYVNWRNIFTQGYGVSQTSPKIEAAYNALNQEYGISLVETMQILRSTAEYFDDPSEGYGLGSIDLRKLLVSDSQGNPTRNSEGKFYLKSLDDLHAQANTVGEVSVIADGDVLTAHFSDPNVAHNIRYEWVHADRGIAIEGENDSVYNLRSGENAADIRVEVTYDDQFNNDNFIRSVAPRAIGPGEDGTVTLITPGNKSADILQAGDTLTATLSDPDNPEAFLYSWIKIGGTLQQGISDTYVLEENDFGNNIAVRIYYADDHSLYNVITSERLVLDDTSGTLAIATPQNADVGTTLTATINDPDGVNANSGLHSDAFIVWYRDGEIIADSLRRIPADENNAKAIRDFNRLDNDQKAEFSWEYVLRDIDAGAEITARALYDGGPRELQDITSVNSFTFTHPGHISIEKYGVDVGDVILPKFVHATVNPDDVTYTWYRNGEEVGSGGEYRITQEDISNLSKVHVEATYEGLDAPLVSNFAYASLLYPGAVLRHGKGASPLRDFAKLGNFTGNDPENEALLVQVEHRVQEHQIRNNDLYDAVTMADGARELIDFRYPYSAYGFVPELELESVESIISLTKDLHAPTDDIIFFSKREFIYGQLDLDKLFEAFPNAVFIERSGWGVDDASPFDTTNREKDIRVAQRESIEKYAAQGKYYFLGYQGRYSEDSQLTGLAPAGEETKDYYFSVDLSELSPLQTANHSYRHHSTAHHVLPAQIQAAHNALNEYYGDAAGGEHISLVETMRILKGAASNADNPSHVNGLGYIDLRKLLVTDADGNPAVNSDGNVSLKSLALLRTQAGLDPQTGLPSDNIAETVNTPASLDITASTTEIQVGTVLTANFNDDDAGNISYQWFRGDDVIDGYTGRSYTVKPGDANDEIKVQVTYQEFGSQKTIESATITPEDSPAMAFLTKETGYDTGLLSNGGYTGDKLLQNGAQKGDTYGVTFFDEDMTDYIIMAKYLDGQKVREYKGHDLGISIYVHHTSSRIKEEDLGKVLHYEFTYENDGVSTTISTHKIKIDTPGTVSLSSSGASAYRVNDVLSATFTDPDATATNIRWVKVKGSEQTMVGTGENYTVQAGDAGSEISAEVTYDEFDRTEILNSNAVTIQNTAGTIRIADGGRQVGSTLRANFTDPDNVGSVTYEWLNSDGAMITSNTNGQYAVQSQDSGKAISVRAVYTEVGATQATTLASESVLIAISDSPGTLNVSASDTIIKVGTTLTADLTDTDRDTNAPITYQWYRESVAIDGATDAAYTLQPGDAGDKITVRATYTEHETTSTKESDPITGQDTKGVLNITMPQDNVAAGSILTAVLNDPDDADSVASSASYQWFRNGELIEQARGENYTLTIDDLGQAITVEANYYDDFGAGTAASESVIIDTSEADGALRILSDGITQVGDILTAELSDPNYIQNVQFQWFADDAEIADADEAYYALRSEDIGKAISVRVTYTDGGGAKTLSTNLGGAVMRADTAGTIEIEDGDTAIRLGGQSISVSLNDPDNARDVKFKLVSLGRFEKFTNAPTQSNAYTTDTEFEIGRDGLHGIAVQYTDDFGTHSFIRYLGHGTRWQSQAEITIPLSDFQVGTVITSNFADFTGDFADELLSYEWQRDGVTIADATASTYTLTEEDIGASIEIIGSYEFRGAVRTVSGRLILTGTDGDDTVTGDFSKNRFAGGDGADTIHGGSGRDDIHGEGGNDTIYGEDDNDRIYGGAGEDTIYGGDNGDSISGGSGDDTIYVGKESDYYTGTDGFIKNDMTRGFYESVYGGGGNDAIYGAGGYEHIYGGSGDDVIYGFAGYDSLYGSSGGDTIYGGSGNDLLQDLGNTGDTDDINLLYGESGRDRLRASVGHNTLDGGDGNDRLITLFNPNYFVKESQYHLIGESKLYGGDGTDLLLGAGGYTTMDGGGDNDYIVLVGDNFQKFDYNYIDTQILSGSQYNRLFNNDYTLSQFGLNTSYLAGISRITPHIETPSAVTIDGGQGNDSLIIYNEVDLSAAHVEISGFTGEKIDIYGQLTLSASQVNALGSVDISGKHARAELVITSDNGVPASLNLSSLGDLDGTLRVTLEKGVTLNFTRSDLTKFQDAGDSIHFAGDGTVKFATPIQRSELRDIQITSALDIDGTITPSIEDTVDTDGRVHIHKPDGRLVVGSTVTAQIVDDDNPRNLQYQWYLGENPIAGATDYSHVLTEADFTAAAAAFALTRYSQYLRVEISYTDDFGSHTLKTPNYVRFAVTENYSGEVRFDIRGEEAGDTISAYLYDLNFGESDTVSSYQWYRGGQAIQGATERTYTLTQSDVAAELSVRLEYSDDFGEATVTGAVVWEAPATLEITKDGNEVGDTVTVTITGDDFNSGGSYSYSGGYYASYSWYQNDVLIENAYGNTYVFRSQDVGKKIQVEVTYKNDYGTRKLQETLAETVRNPRNTYDTDGQVVIEQSDPATTTSTYWTVGGVLSADLRDRDNPDNITYQWLRNGKEISTATAQTYTLQVDDVRQDISVIVRYGDDFTDGDDTTKEVTQTVQDNIYLYTDITGKLTLSGDSLFQASFRDHNNPENIQYAWFSDGVLIEGAEGDSYTPQESDNGKRISVRVRYTDDFGKQELHAIERDIVGGTPSETPTYHTGTLRISSDGNNTEVGDVLTATLTDMDGINPDIAIHGGVNINFAQGSYIIWQRNGQDIADSFTHLPFYAGTSTQATYTLRAEDAGQSITARVAYQDEQIPELMRTAPYEYPKESINPSSISPRYTFHHLQSNAITARAGDEAGQLSIFQAGSDVGDLLVARLDDPDSVSNVTYAWSRDGVTFVPGGASYSLTAADAGKTISLQVQYNDSFNTGAQQSLTASVAVGSVGTGEGVSDSADDDLQAFAAALGNFTGKDPANELMPVQIYAYRDNLPELTEIRSQRAAEIYRDNALDDTALQVVELPVAERYTREPDIKEHIATAVKNLNLPGNNLIIMESYAGGVIPGDSAWPKIFHDISNLHDSFSEENIAVVNLQMKSVPTKIHNALFVNIAVQDGDRVEEFQFIANDHIHHVIGSTFALHDISLYPHIVNPVVAKIEAAFNALNNAYNDVSLLDTLKILKAVAVEDTPPDYLQEFSILDLTKLLNTGDTALRSFEDLRTSAMLEREAVGITDDEITIRPGDELVNIDSFGRTSDDRAQIIVDLNQSDRFKRLDWKADGDDFTIQLVLEGTGGEIVRDIATMHDAFKTYGPKSIAVRQNSSDIEKFYLNLGYAGGSTYADTINAYTDIAGTGSYKELILPYQGTASERESGDLGAVDINVPSGVPGFFEGYGNLRPLDIDTPLSNNRAEYHIYSRAGSDRSNVIDRAFGSTGDDTFYITESRYGATRVEGFGGNDTVIYDGAQGNLNIDLSIDVWNVFNHRGFDYLQNIEKIIITNGAGYINRITGSARAETIQGGDGYDTIIGNGGSDTLLGGAGRDVITVTGDEVRVDGGEGHDTLKFSTDFIDYLIDNKALFSGFEAINISKSGVDFIVELDLETVREVFNGQVTVTGYEYKGSYDKIFLTDFADWQSITDTEGRITGYSNSGATINIGDDVAVEALPEGTTYTVNINSTGDDFNFVDNPKVPSFNFKHNDVLLFDDVDSRSPITNLDDFQQAVSGWAVLYNGDLQIFAGNPFEGTATRLFIRPGEGVDFDETVEDRFPGADFDEEAWNTLVEALQLTDNNFIG